MEPARNKLTRKRVLRATWGVADQALTSLMGLGLSIVVAHVASPAEFGAFALALGLYYAGQSSSRAVASDPFIVRFSQGAESDINDARARAAGTALVVGVALGLATSGTSVLVAGGLRGALLAIGIVFPFLLLQDFMRFAFFAAQRGYLAFGVDAVWVCSAGGLVALSLELGIRNAPVFIAEWGVASGFAALVALRVTRVFPRPDHALTWLRSQRDLAPRFLAEATLVVGIGSLALVLVGSIAGLQAAGSLRGATVLLGPLTVLFAASTTFGVPEGVMARGESNHALRALALQVSAFLTVIAVLWTTALTLLPSPLGKTILGDSWAGAHDVVLPMGLATCAIAGLSGAFVGLRALAAARQSLRVRTITGPLILAGAVAGAVAHGAIGAAIGIAISNCVAALIAWRAFDATLTQDLAGGEVAIDLPSEPADLARKMSA